MLIPLRASPCTHIDIEREYEVTYARHYQIDTGKGIRQSWSVVTAMSPLMNRKRNTHYNAIAPSQLRPQ